MTVSPTAMQPSVQSSFLKSGFAPYSASSGTRASHTIHALAGESTQLPNERDDATLSTLPASHLFRAI